MPSDTRAYVVMLMVLYSRTSVPILSRLLLIVGSLVCSSTMTAGEIAPVPLPPPPPRPSADSGPTRVEVTGWFADISEIDSAEQSFSASLVVVLRWHDPALAHGGQGNKTYALDQVWHPEWLVENGNRFLARTLPETVDVTGDGEVIYRQRLVGAFNQPLNLRRFPFDRETFRVRFVALGYSPNEVAFSPAADAVAGGLPNAVGHGTPLTIKDWTVTGVDASPQPYELTPGLALSGYTMEFHAARRPQHYLLKVMLPLLLIVLMSGAVFWIDPTLAGPQISVAVTSMLTLIAYRFAIGNEVPKLPYLTLLDALILMASILVFLSLVEVMVTSSLALKDRVETARAIDRYSRWIFPIALAVPSLALYLFWN